MKTFLAAVGLIGFCATPALADWYVVQDTSTKRCSIVEQRPTTTTMTVVSGNTVYRSRTEAENAMKTVKVCETSPSVGGPAVPAPAPR